MGARKSVRLFLAISSLLCVPVFFVMYERPTESAVPGSVLSDIDVFSPKLSSKPASSSDLDDCESWLLDYSSWHAQQVELLKSGHEVQILVYTCNGDCGGLGDRLSGMLAAFYVAIATNRLFIIDHSAPFLLRETLVPSEIDWDNVLHINTSSPSSTINLIDPNQPMERFASLFEMHNTGVPVLRAHVNRYYIAMGLWTPSITGSPETPSSLFIGSMHRIREKSCNNCSKYCRGALTTRQTFQLAFSHLFSFSEAVEQRAIEMMLESELRGEQYVGIHARLGGSLTSSSKVAQWEDPERHSLDDLNLFLNCARSKIERIEYFSVLLGHGPKPRLQGLIFSDSNAFKEKARRIDALFKYCPTTTLFHVDKGKSPEPKVLQLGNTDVYAELLLLSKSTCIVGSHSTFSGVAASISRFLHEDKRCFAMFDNCEQEDYDYFEETERRKLTFLKHSNTTEFRAWEAHLVESNWTTRANGA